MQEALLIQKIEFLEIELEESKARESQLKSMNESLVAILNNDANLLSSCSLQELQRSSSQYQSEIKSLKKRYNAKCHLLEKQLFDLAMTNKELSLALKEASLQFESKKTDLNSQIKTLEVENTELEAQISFLEDELGAYKELNPHSSKIKELNILLANKENELKQFQDSTNCEARRSSFKKKRIAPLSLVFDNN